MKSNSLTKLSLTRSMVRTFLLFLVVVSFNSCNNSQKKTDWVECELIPVCENGKWGYINTKGEWIIQPQYILNDSKIGGESISFFAEGLARVKGANGLFGFINTKGDFVIQPIYKRVTSFHEGVALCVKENETIEAINTDGTIRFKLGLNVTRLSVFYEGLAACRNDNMTRLDSTELLYKSQGYIDLAGKQVIPYNFVTGDIFREGFASVVYKDERDSLVHNLINRKGDFVSKSSFDNVHTFTEGLAAVKVKSKWGYIDSTGTMIIQPQFDEAGYFANSLAKYKIGNSWGYIDKRGNRVISEKYDGCSNFTNGIALVIIGESYGYIKTDGSYLIEPSFKSATTFGKNGLAIVKNMFGKSYIIKADGKALNNSDYDICRHYQCNYMLGITKIGSDAEPKYRFEIINPDGSILGNKSFDEVKLTEEVDEPEDIIYFDSDFFDYSAVVDSIVELFHYPMNNFSKGCDGCKVLDWLKTLEKFSFNEKKNIIKTNVRLPHKSQFSAHVYSIFDSKIEALDLFSLILSDGKPTKRSCFSAKFQLIALPYECESEDKAKKLRESLLERFKRINKLSLNLNASEKNTYILNNQSQAISLEIMEKTVIIKFIPLK